MMMIDERERPRGAISYHDEGLDKNATFGAHNTTHSSHCPSHPYIDQYITCEFLNFDNALVQWTPMLHFIPFHAPDPSFKAGYKTEKIKETHVTTTNV